MNRFIVVLFVLALVALSAPALRAQDQPAYVTDYLGQIEYVQGQVLALEGAVPQDKYSWRPAEGVRSIGEVYRHIAGGNYLILQLMGVQAPAEVNFTMDEKKWDSGPMDKATVAALLKASFDHVKGSVSKMTEADLAMKVDFFGMQMTKRSALMSLLSHVHEHLGQSIAYARTNGIVPPWTAAEMAKQAEKDKGK
jgi:uncharacterized damage-inducible protein DinB